MVVVVGDMSTDMVDTRRLTQPSAEPSIDQVTNQFTHQPINQSTNPSINQSLTQTRTCAGRSRRRRRRSRCWPSTSTRGTRSVRVCELVEMCERIGYEGIYVVCMSVYHPSAHPPTRPYHQLTLPPPYLSPITRPPPQGFKSVLMARLDGSFDATKYEDGCRQLMGNKSYMLYTLDKARIY